VGLAAAAHIAPAGLWLPGVRRVAAARIAGRGRPDHVALTFDDGPDPASTPRFLAELDRLDVRATFFLVGSALERHPGLGRDLVAAGHEVAVHGWEHRRPWRPTPRRDLAETRRCVAAVRDLCGTRPRWYRPPYGILTGGLWAAAARSGLRTVLWSAWGRDWTAEATAGSVLAEVRRDLAGGGTVLLHDTDRQCAPGSWHATLTALPRLIAHCRRQGWSVGPLVEHGHR
jgi:peptidoglycan/xylan/chitin deacetylase (PgdA/CDA1 family)